MGDPGFMSGLIGVVVDRLIQVIEKEVMTAITCREELRSLEKIVKEIRPVNMEIQQYRIAIRQSQSESVKNIEPATVNKCLKNLNSILEDAREIVLKCHVSAYNLVSRYILSKNIRKCIDSLQGHLERLPLIGFTYQLHSDLTNRLQSQEAAQNQSSIPSTSQPSLASDRQEPIQEPCIVGQDELFVNLKSLVMGDKEIASATPSRIGVFGMGGAGKTPWLEQTRTLEVFPPISQGGMPLLKKLGLVFCLNVKTLPPGLQNLQNLREVHVYESPLILKSMEEEGSEAWSTVRQLEGEMHVEILKESTANYRHKRMEKRMGNKYWWDRFLSNMWMDFNM